LMREIDVKNAIIFCNRKKDVGIVHRSLLRHGFSVGALHGDLDQHQRTATLDAFRNGTIAFLAASDVAARGLDIPDVSHIFNYDVPIHPEDYIHRIGRTGRAGREGFAAMLVTPKDHKALKAIERMLKQEIPWIDGAHSEAELSETREARPNGNGRNRRGGRSRGGKRPQGPGAQHQASNAPRNAPPQSGNRDKKPDEPRANRDEPRADPPKHKHHGERKSHQAAPTERPPGRAPQLQPASAKQQGMGDHVPAFMMRPVRVT
jgi:superfamily II DNA/RNA helicase